MPGRMNWLATVALFVSASVAHAGKPEPMYLHPEFDSISTDIHAALLLPCLDARVDTTVKHNFNKTIVRSVGSNLPTRGYKLVKWGKNRPAPELDIEGFRSGDSTWIRSLPADTNRFALVICIEDAGAKRGFGTSSNVELSGALFDVQAGSVLWRAKGIKQAGQGGLAGMMMGGAMNDAAIEGAAIDLIKALPKRKRK